jgi:hypothetical protein
VLGNEDVPCARDHMFPGEGNLLRGGAAGRCREKCQKRQCSFQVSSLP